MSIAHLAITHLRNFSSVELKPGPDVNIITGSNGSGKTSLLEAIYLLGRGHPFDAHDRNSLIQVGQKSCTVFGSIALAADVLTIPVGVTRAIDGSHKIRISGDDVKSKSSLVELLPLQVISPDTFKLLAGGPNNRRQFIDWGVFHVEHLFYESWRRLNRSLKQRNKLLRRGNIASEMLAPWDKEFVEHADVITKQRSSYVAKLEPLFKHVLAQLSDLENLTLSFYPGWDQTKSLEEVMVNSLPRDTRQGYTSFGPQRADLKVRYLQHNAADTLSRGQQKIVICAMKLAHGYLYTQATGRTCIYLIDDLAAELDIKHRALLCKLLASLDCQLFITSADASTFDDCWETKQIKMFHVEQGTIEQ